MVAVCSQKLGPFTCKLWSLCASCGDEFFTVERCMTACKELERKAVTFGTYIHTVRLEEKCAK